MSITHFLHHILTMVPNRCVEQIKKVKTKYRCFIQNRALRKISFKKLHDPTEQLYKDLKILKFCDIVHLQNCIFMNQIEQNEELAKSFSELKYCGYNHNYQTRSAARKFLNIPCVKTDIMEHNLLNTTA